MFELDDLKIEFIMDNNEYTCNIYYIDSDNYAIRLYKGFNTSEANELFSTYIDSSGTEVSGNVEVRTTSDIYEVVQKCYQIYKFYVNNKMLSTGNREDED